MRIVKTLFGPARPVGGVILAFLCAVLAWVVRYRFVEPAILGARCDEGDHPWWCGIRTSLIVFTEWKGFGLLALVLAILTLVMRGEAGDRVGHAAMAVAGAGLILYNATFSGVALVVAALWLALRRERESAA